MRSTIAALALLCAWPAAPAQTTPMEALTPAQKARLAPRRPTRQIVGSPLPTVTEGYRPTLTPRAAASGVPDPVGTLAVHPAATGPAPNAALAPLSVPLANCAAGSCTGTNGQHYNTTGNGVTVDPAGRTCHKIGATVQCF